MPESTFDLDWAADQVWALLEQAFTKSVALCDAAEELAHDALAVRGQLYSSDFETLNYHLLKELAALPSTAICATFMFEVGVLQDVDYFMPSLMRDGLTISEGKHDLDPSSDTFYDYSLLDFIALPFRATPYVHGPYIDLGGTNTFTITVSSPVHINGRFLGEACIDISLESYERSLVPILHRAPGSLSVLNAENRVVVSNDVGRPIGALIEVDEGILHPCGDLGWRMLYLP